MDDLTCKCDNLSLLEWEGKKVVLKKKNQKPECVLAAKFFTKRALNIEVVARTFRPLWRTKASFHISNVGDNMLLFTFDQEIDTVKVLLGEPWSYDRHLVVLQRFEGKKPIKELEFNRVKFWIQIHDLPYKFMNPVSAIEIGESIGEVVIPRDDSEMRGGTFMWVRVWVDVSRPLCRGRKVNFEDDLEGWVSFQYERLPNICFWCGMVSHDDKECELWLKSNENLPPERQQYGHWIKASLFSPGKRQVIEVKGYDSEPVVGPVVQSERGRVGVSREAFVPSNGAQMDDVGLAMPTMMADQPNEDGVTGELVCIPVEIPATSNSPQNVTDFETVIEELDREITDSVPIPNALVAEVICDIKRKELGPDVRHGTGKLLSESEGVVQENISASFLPNLGSGEFSMGWIEASDKRKNVKTGHSKQASKGSVTVVRTDGLDLTKEHKKGTWTRLPCRPNTE